MPRMRAHSTCRRPAQQRVQRPSWRTLPRCRCPCAVRCEQPPHGHLAICIRIRICICFHLSAHRFLSPPPHHHHHHHHAAAHVPPFAARTMAGASTPPARSTSLGPSEPHRPPPASGATSGAATPPTVRPACPCPCPCRWRPCTRSWLNAYLRPSVLSFSADATADPSPICLCFPPAPAARPCPPPTHYLPQRAQPVCCSLRLRFQSAVGPQCHVRAPRRRPPTPPAHPGPRPRLRLSHRFSPYSRPPPSAPAGSGAAPRVCLPFPAGDIP